MNVKEKLVELLEPYANDLACEQQSGSCELTSCRSCNARNLADHLIANGVTVQEWIPAKGRLPEPFVSVLVQMPGEEPFPTVREGFISNEGIWQSAMFRREPGEVTHWQPMPQPPKEDL